jgi:hypothetical protein
MSVHPKESAVQRLRRSFQFLLCLILLMVGYLPHAEAHTFAVDLESAPRQENGEIFFTVDYLIEADVPDNENCTADGYRLNIIMEGVGEPTPEGYLEGVTVVVDLSVNLGPGAWWESEPQPTHAFPATAKLEYLPSSPTTGMTVAKLVEEVAEIPAFIGTRSCIASDGRIETITANFLPIILLNTFHLMELASGGMKEVEPGNYLSRFHAVFHNDGVRRISQRVWWGDHRVPSLVVDPDVEGVFLSGVPADVEVTYDPRWADDVNTGGDTWVKLGPGQWIKRSQSAPQKFIEKIPLAPMSPTKKPIEGWVQLDTNQRASERKSKPFTVTPKQTVVTPEEISATKQKVAKAITYKLERNMPPSPFEKKWTAPGWFPPPLKGKETMIKAQLKLTDEYESTATPAVHATKLGFEGELEIDDKSGKLSIEGTANMQYSQAGLEFLDGKGKADLQIGLKETVGPFDLVPTLKPVAAAVSLDTWVEKYAKVEAGIFIFGNGEVEIVKAAGGLDWKAVVMSGVRPIVKFQVGEGKVSLELEAKGEGRLKFHLNMPGDLFQGAEGEVAFTGAITVLHCKWAKEVKYTFGVASAVAQSLDSTADSVGICAESPSAASLTAEAWHGSADLFNAAVDLVAGDLISVTLASNLLSQAAPTLGAMGSPLCWVSRRGDAPASGNTEIVCAQGTLPQLAAPQSVTADTYADAAPQSALAAANTPVVAWWRHDDPNRPDTVTLDAAFLSHGEVMASVFDPSTLQWTTPITLGTPGVLDYEPVAAGNGVDGAFVAWRSNAAGQLNGFGDTADTIWAAHYNPATKSWGAATSLLSTRGLIEMTAAYGPTEAALLYAIDQDGNVDTDDTEIVGQRFVGGVWQQPQRLTVNAVADTQPRITYRADGTPILVWLQTDADGRRFVAYQEGWNGSVSLTPMDGDHAPGYLSNVAVNSAGDALLLWRSLYDVDSVDGRGDLSFAVRRASTGHWSTPLRLTNDAGYERNLSARWKDADTLAAVYQITADDGSHALQYVERTVSAADAAVDALDIALDPVNPAPGTPLTATVTVRNLGMEAQPNITVRVDEVDAWTGAVKRQIHSGEIALRGGEALAIPVAYTSGQGANHLRVALSCRGAACGEALNDSATVAVNQPNLVLTGAGVVQRSVNSVVRAAVTNSGVVSATMVAMTVTAGLPEGETELGSVFFHMNGETGVLPGEEVFGEFILPTDLDLGESVPLTVTVAPAFGQPELSVADNTRSIVWQRLPNLYLLPDFVDKTQIGGQTTFTVTVFNDSALATPASTLTAYSADPDEGGSVLGSGEIPALEPYGQAAVTLLLAGAVDGVYLRANPDQSFVERTTADNDLSTIAPADGGSSEFRLMLPSIYR